MFDPRLSIGQVITEKEVHDIFSCQTTLGIRMSKPNHLFVIMSGSAKKKVYNDRWDEEAGILYYNGTDINADASGNQELKKGRGNNNKQLYDEWGKPEEEKWQIFLFVKKEENRCVYKGEVVLDREPFREPRHDDPTRKVWIFPLRRKTLAEETVQERAGVAEESAYYYTEADLLAKIKGKKSNKGNPTGPRTYSMTSVAYERDQDNVVYVKKRAKGVCDLCKQEAPFVDKKGHPYLEAHHVLWLSEGGADDIDNMVALCPACHRKMHILARKEDVALLEKVLLHYMDEDR